MRPDGKEFAALQTTVARLRKANLKLRTHNAHLAQNNARLGKLLAPSSPPAAEPPLGDLMLASLGYGSKAKELPVMLGDLNLTEILTPDELAWLKELPPDSKPKQRGFDMRNLYSRAVLWLIRPALELNDDREAAVVSGAIAAQFAAMQSTNIKNPPDWRL